MSTIEEMKALEHRWTASADSADGFKCYTEANRIRDCVADLTALRCELERRGVK